MNDQQRTQAIGAQETQQLGAAQPGQPAMSRADYERAFQQTYGDPHARHAQHTRDDYITNDASQGVTFGATSVMPQQRIADAASPYQPYGQPTANSAQYAQWADQQRQDNEFNMNRGRKKHTGRNILIVLLVIVLGIGLGAGAFLLHIDRIIGLGNDRDGVMAALRGQTAGEPYYVLLIGNDSREGVQGSDAEWAEKEEDGSDGLADVIMLARIDEKNKQVTLLSVPRDTPWQSEDGSWGKINSELLKGKPALINAVSQLTGVPISHYAEIHMSGFMDLVDLVGGVDVDVPHVIDYHEALTSQEVHIDAGRQHLNGLEAEVFAREREGYDDFQDMNRQSNVRAIAKDIFDKIVAMPPWKLPGTITACAECVTTDMSSAQLVLLMAAVGSPDMYSGTGPYDGEQNPYVGDLWLCYVNEQGWARVMDVVKRGDDPSEVSYEGDEVYQAGSR